MALLEIDDIWGGYGQTAVVRGVSMAVEEGTCVGLIGPNGHGKTTLLQLITGLMRPWSGAVRFDGEDVTGLPAFKLARRGVVHVPQGDALFTDLSVEDNLLAAAQADQWRRRTELLREAYELFPVLEERRGQTAGTLSGGQKRMLAIARGLMMRTRLILIDEPSLGLAPRVVADVYATVQKLRAAGVSLLIVEENPQRLRAFADHAYLLEAGEIVKRGSVGELLDDEQLTRTYLGLGAPVAQLAPERK